MISAALSKRASCKVQLLNYRSGSLDKPFWNVLSISPLLHRGQLQLYAAYLQDYSYHISRLVSLSPSQYCRAAEHYQRDRHIPHDLPSLILAKPMIYEADDTYPLTSARPQESDSPITTPPIKRLGWNKLVLEPEHLTDRVIDAVLTLGASYETQRRCNAHGECFVVDGCYDGVAFRVVVNEDVDGSYRITCARMSGDTFTYHAVFRKIKEHLGDVSHGPSTRKEQTASEGRLALMGREIRAADPREKVNIGHKCTSDAASKYENSDAARFSTVGHTIPASPPASLMAITLAR